ncbi:MAG: dTMP kinase [Ardenticatenaceae bacterium]|nr:dTMP kinase [Ardenticatenaceae bacterium]MCB8987666.1 dTMP kinase [Ardenticatenaceae bacterium]
MFITLEGPEGSGKSSQIGLLAGFLREQGYEVVQTREPGGTRIGDQIRACLHDVANTEMTAVTEVLLYAASRAQHVDELIRPALQAGKVVLCDRFADSTIAYQGYGRGLNLDNLHTLTRIATGGLKPDLTLLLDIDVERGLARRQVGGEEMNRLDLEAVTFHQRVRRGYHALAAAEPGRWITIDADRPVDEVQVDLCTAVLARLSRHQANPA